MKEIRTKIEIDASAEIVWRILTDFQSFPEWNPFIQRIEGQIKKGENIDVFLKLPGKKGMRFRPRLLTVEPGKELRWIGRLGIPGIFDGEHIFSIETVEEDKIHFIQREKFSGLLSSVLLRSIASPTTQAFKEMNEALKRRSEKTKKELL
jgi:hypothetical protein